MPCGENKLRTWEAWLWASQENARKGRPGMCTGHGLSCTDDPVTGLCDQMFNPSMRCCRYWSPDGELTRAEAVDRLNVAVHGGEPDDEITRAADAVRDARRAERQRSWDENQDHVGLERARELMAGVVAVHGRLDTLGA